MEEDERPALMEKKQRFYRVPFAEPGEFAQAPVDCILKFIRHTGLME